MTVPSYRELASKTLEQAATELNQIPTGSISCAVLEAHSAKAAAIATISVAQALLEIGDVLRKALARNGGEPDGK